MQRVIQLLAVAAVASLGAAGPVPMQRRGKLLTLSITIVDVELGIC